MNRRKFLKNAVFGAGAALAAPYLLPSGRLFARTTATLADHVILVMFAGGVRQQESVLQRYLAGSQNENIEGNILYNLFDGTAPIDKIVYGTDGNLAGEIPIPRVLNSSIQQQGTIFREMRSSNAGHFGGLNVMLQGNNVVKQGLKQRPLNPTIFEYLRRHGGIPATKTWFVGNGIMNSVPLLSHSIHPDYGQKYAGNFLAPSITFSDIGFEHLSDAKIYHPETELDPMYKMKYFLDNNFHHGGATVTGINNTEEEKQAIKTFLRDMFTATTNQSVVMPPVNDNGDLRTMGYACEVMKRFTPNLTVINLNNVDGCHSNFTGYLRNLHRADHGVGFIWDYVQTQIPQMAGNTIMIVVPECGRNLEPNPIKDENDWLGYDHSDANTYRIFGAMVGKNVPSNLGIGNENNPVGLTFDIAPTIAEILGIKNEVMNSGLLHSTAMSLFDRI
ncbi:MAG: hypothetical protein ACKVTZ_20465 [Bacteroidia bacterium]